MGLSFEIVKVLQQRHSCSKKSATFTPRCADTLHDVERAVGLIPLGFVWTTPADHPGPPHSRREPHEGIRLRNGPLRSPRSCSWVPLTARGNQTRRAVFNDLLKLGEGYRWSISTGPWDSWRANKPLAQPHQHRSVSGVGAAARRRPIAVALRLPSPTSPGPSTNTGAEHGAASPPRPPSSARWYAPPDAAFP